MPPRRFGTEISGNQRSKTALSHDQKIEIKTLWKHGQNACQIAKHMGVHRSTTSRLVKRYATTNSIARLTGSGRHRLIEERQQRLLIRLLLQNPRIQYDELKTEANLDGINTRTI